MNIFILDRDVTKCAEYHVDKHVVKMILESVQLLSTAVRHSGIDAGYRATHINHPCSKWVRESLNNWYYLFELTTALHSEWQYRFNHIMPHKSYQMMLTLPEPNIESVGMTPFALAMPIQYQTNDPVESYRNYYRHEKAHLFKWSKHQQPYWITEC